METTWISKNVSPSGSLIHMLNSYNSFWNWACVWWLQGFSPPEKVYAMILGTTWEYCISCKVGEGGLRKEPWERRTCLDPHSRMLLGRSILEGSYIEVRELKIHSRRTSYIQVPLEKSSWTTTYRCAHPSYKTIAPEDLLCLFTFYNSMITCRLSYHRL